MVKPQTNKIYCGDVLDVLRGWPDGFIQCCVTSPPYWGLRDYGIRGQLGLEKTPEEYTEKMVEIFREVRRVLRDDGTLWLNMGDSYASDTKGSGGPSEKQLSNAGSRYKMNQRLAHGLKPKDLVGIPWRVAFALQSDGWYLRSDIIWSKPNPMPESVRDRPTKAHEYLFLFSKNKKYYYDQDAVREGFADERMGNPGGGGQYARDCPYPNKHESQQSGLQKGIWNADKKAFGRNLRTVWTIATQPYPEAHFATFPEALVEKPILAGTSERGCCPECGAGWERISEKTGRKIQCHWAPGTDRKTEIAKGKHGSTSVLTTGYKQEYKTIGWRPTCDCQEAEDKDGVFIEQPDHWRDLWAYPPVPCLVLDPFMGSGTVAKVALRAGRQFIGIELNPEYIKLTEKRIEPLMRQHDLFTEAAE